MSFTYHTGYDSAAAFNRMLEDRKRQKAEEAAQLRVEEDDCYRLIQSAGARDRLQGYRSLLLVLARKHGFSIRWHPGSGGKAYWGHYIETPAIDVNGDPEVEQEHAAVGLHEAAHMIVGQCPDDGVVHRRDPTVKDAWHCIACETAATHKALSMAPFTRPMFDRLARGLMSYRRGTPASPTQIAKLDALKGTITYAEHRERWRKWNERIERQTRAAASLRRA